MERAYEVLANREKGQYTVSIATSLAFEGLFGIYPEREGPSRIKEIDAVYINLQTLFRNLIGSLEKEVRGIPHPVDFATVMHNELTTLDEVIRQGSGDMVEVVPYLFSYKSINRKFPYALHWNPSTQNQMDLNQLERNVFREFDDIGSIIAPIKADLDFDDDNRNVALLTHHPVNLLNRYRFRNLLLLESHTGYLKPSTQWASKLTGLKDIVTVPFDRMTLQVFGDGVMFKSMPVKLKRHLVDISNKNGWGPTTTRDKIIHDVKKERDPTLEAFVMKLY